MELLNELISSYAIPILGSILTAIAGFVGLKIKNIYEKYVNDKTKKDVVQDVVKMVEQVYTDLKGQDKYNEAVTNITEMLNEKNITITDLEIRVLIESACSEFAKSLKGE